MSGSDRTTPVNVNATRGIIQQAYDAARRGWHVFPLRDKQPAIPQRGEQPVFDFLPVFAPWAVDVAVEDGPGRWTTAKGAAWIATRDERTIREIFAFAVRERGADGVGITSDLICGDADDPLTEDRWPARILELAGRLPGNDTPGGGRHFFFRPLPGQEIDFGALYSGAGDHIGDIRHCSGKGYSVLYPGCPTYDEAAAAQTDPGLFVWLDEMRANRRRVSTSTPAAGGRRQAAKLNPDTYTGPFDPFDPAAMPRGKEGAHPYLQDGTWRDAVLGLYRRDAWVAALKAAGRSAHEAAAEFDRAYGGAQEKLAAERAQEQADAAAEAAQQEQIDADADPPAGEGAAEGIPGAAAGQGNREPENAQICAVSEPAPGGDDGRQERDGTARQAGEAAAGPGPDTGERAEEGAGGGAPGERARRQGVGRPSPADDPRFEVDPDARGFRQAVQQTGWSGRFNVRGARCELRRPGSDRWELVGDEGVVDDLINACRGVAVLRHGRHDFAVKGGVVAERRAIRAWCMEVRDTEAPGTEHYEETIVYCHEHPGARVQFFQIADAIGAKDPNSGRLNIRRSVKQDMRRALEDFGARERSVRVAGKEYSVKGWIIPGEPRGVRLAGGGPVAG